MTVLATAPADVDNEGMPTPSDLRAMRLLLGLTRLELAALLGTGLSDDDVRRLERSRTWFVHQEHYVLLSQMLDRVNGQLDFALAGAPPEFLIAYPNDGAFKDYAPELAEWMRFNSVHLMFTARLLDAWLLEGHRPEVMELVPKQYEEFRTGKRLADTPETRRAWADDYRKLVKLRPGLPGPGATQKD